MRGQFRMEKVRKMRLPSAAGTYVLLLYLRKGRQIEVGHLGAIFFSRGWYAYVGSAYGPGGLAARLGRHQREIKKLRWHIDYLRTRAEPRWVWFNCSATPLEHTWAAGLLKQGAFAINGFGCSDCRCPSHLFRISRLPAAHTMMSGLGGGAVCRRLPL